MLLLNVPWRNEDDLLLVNGSAIFGLKKWRASFSKEQLEILDKNEEKRNAMAA